MCGKSYVPLCLQVSDSRMASEMHLHVIIASFVLLFFVCLNPDLAASGSDSTGLRPPAFLRGGAAGGDGHVLLRLAARSAAGARSLLRSWRRDERAEEAQKSCEGRS